MTRVAGLMVALLLSLAGCSTMPRDPGGTLERVRETSVLRVGASPSGDLVRPDGDAVGGSEARLVTGYATSLGARVRWRVGGEEELVAAMERGEIDVIVGGLSAASPWVDTVSLTRPYAVSTDHGRQVEHVMAVPMGENALLVSLERYLDEEAP